MSIRYTYLRNGVYHYQRKVPLDLLARYDGTKLIKHNLNTRSHSKAAEKVAALNTQYEQCWDDMRKGKMITPSSVIESAKRLLKQYGLNPLPANNPSESESLFRDLVVEPKRE